MERVQASHASYSLAPSSETGAVRRGLLVRVAVRCRGMFVGLLAVFMRRGRVMLSATLDVGLLYVLHDLRSVIDADQAHDQRVQARSVNARLSNVGLVVDGMDSGGHCAPPS